jgi:hypothetical protein
LPLQEGIDALSVRNLPFMAVDEGKATEIVQLGRGENITALRREVAGSDPAVRPAILRGPLGVVDLGHDFSGRAHRNALGATMQLDKILELEQVFVVCATAWVG